MGQVRGAGVDNKGFKFYNISVRVRGRAFLYLKDYLSLEVGREALSEILADADCPQRVEPIRWYPAHSFHLALDLYVYEVEDGDLSAAERAGRFFFHKFAEERPWELVAVVDPMDKGFLSRLWHSFYSRHPHFKAFGDGAVLSVPSEHFGLAPTYALSGWIGAMGERLGVRLAAVALRERVVEFIISW